MSDGFRDKPDKWRKFGEKLVERAPEMAQSFKVELGKKLTEAKRAVDETKRLAEGTAVELSRFRPERLGEFAKALGRRGKDVPSDVVAEGKRQVQERVETAGKIAEDGKTLADPNASKEAKYRAGGDLLKRGFDEAASRAGNRAWKAKGPQSASPHEPHRSTRVDDAVVPHPTAEPPPAGAGGRRLPVAAAPGDDGYDDVRERLRTMRERSPGPSDRLRDKRKSAAAPPRVGEGEFWQAMNTHGHDWDRVCDAHAGDLPTLARLRAMREGHIDEMCRTVRGHDGDWNNVRERLRESDPQRLAVLAAARREFIDDGMREAGLSRAERAQIRGTQQSRKPTSDDDVAALHPHQANDIERALGAKLERAGIAHGDPGKALDCNVYTEFRSHRFDPRTHPADYARDAERELMHGYVGVLRDGGEPARELVRERKIALAEHRTDLEKAAKAGRVPADEAARRGRGADLHRSAIDGAEKFYAEHLEGKTPAEIADARRAARHGLGSRAKPDSLRDPSAAHLENEQAGLVRAFESDSSMSRGGYHSNVTVGQKPESHPFDSVEQMTAELEHRRGYYKAREHDTPYGREKAGKYIDRLYRDAETFQQSHPQDFMDRQRRNAQRAAEARGGGKPTSDEAAKVRDGIARLKAGEKPWPEQESAIASWMRNLDRRAAASDPLHSSRSAQPAGGMREVKVSPIEPQHGRRNPEAVASAKAASRRIGAEETPAVTKSPSK